MRLQNIQLRKKGTRSPMRDNKISLGLMPALYWLPRGLAICFILFLAIFALDVFTASAPWYQIALGLFIHLIPNFILLITLLIAWKHEQLGGLLFIIISIGMWSALHNPFWVNAMLIGPILATGILFLVHNYYEIKLLNEGDR